MRINKRYETARATEAPIGAAVDRCSNSNVCRNNTVYYSAHRALQENADSQVSLPTFSDQGCLVTNEKERTAALTHANTRHVKGKKWFTSLTAVACLASGCSPPIESPATESKVLYYTTYVQGSIAIARHCLKDTPYDEQPNNKNISAIEQPRVDNDYIVTVRPYRNGQESLTFLAEPDTNRIAAASQRTAAILQAYDCPGIDGS